MEVFRTSWCFVNSNKFSTFESFLQLINGNPNFTKCEIFSEKSTTNQIRSEMQARMLLLKLVREQKHQAQFVPSYFLR